MSSRCAKCYATHVNMIDNAYKCPRCGEARDTQRLREARAKIKTLEKRLEEVNETRIATFKSLEERHEECAEAEAKLANIWHIANCYDGDHVKACDLIMSTIKED